MRVGLVAPLCSSETWAGAAGLRDGLPVSDHVLRAFTRNCGAQGVSRGLKLGRRAQQSQVQALTGRESLRCSNGGTTQAGRQSRVRVRDRAVSAQSAGQGSRALPGTHLLGARGMRLVMDVGGTHITSV